MDVCALHLQLNCLCSDAGETLFPFQEEDEKLVAFAGLRALPAKRPVSHGIFEKKWDSDIGKERIFLPSDASMVDVAHLGLEVLKDELEKLGLKCGGTLEQRAGRLWRIRGLVGPDVSKFLSRPENQDLVAGKPKEKRRNMDVSVQLVLDRERERQEKKARKTQGPLLPGLERKIGQKSLPKLEVKEREVGKKVPERDEFDKL